MVFDTNLAGRSPPLHPSTASDLYVEPVLQNRTGFSIKDCSTSKITSGNVTATPGKEYKSYF